MNLFEADQYEKKETMMKISPAENKDNQNENEKQIIRKMQLKPKFYSRYEKASLPIKSLFIKLITMADEKCITNKASDTPDYRLVKKNGINNFCLIMITPTSSCLKLHLQRNRYGLHSDLLTFSPVTEGRHNGPDWIEIIVQSETELEEAFRLIYTIYQKS